jgi:hypothetical protein
MREDFLMRRAICSCCWWLFLATLGVPARANLEIRDVKAAYGPLGPERKSLEITPGDTIYFRFAITGVRTDAAGRADGEVRVRLTNSAGKTVVENKEPAGGLLALGGQMFPGNAQVTFGPDAPAGDYKVAVTVRDNIGKADASFERTLTIAKPAFALVQIGFSRDEKGNIPCTAGGTLGEILYVRCKAVGFERAKAQPHVVFSMQVLDARGKPQLPEPVRVDFTTEDPGQIAKIGLVDFKGVLSLNRTGDFRVRVEATDEAGKQKSEFVMPLRVTTP